MAVIREGLEALWGDRHTIRESDRYGFGSYIEGEYAQLTETWKRLLAP